MMFTIIGGTYTEVCDHPRWNEVVGSGARAAAAASASARGLPGHGLRLVTWASKEEEKRLKKRMNACEALVQVRSRSQEIQFIYPHSLHRPEMYPTYKRIDRPSDEEITVENCLVFGLVECAPQVKAKRLVYDPQGGQPVLPFGRTGHSADHVAIVANLGEARQMAQQLGWQGNAAPTVRSVGRHLLREPTVDVVVIKDGPRGATVFAKGLEQHVPAYFTPSVFKIGSGDVFSGIFAVHWAEMEIPPGEAAELASIATAYYCWTRAHVLPVTFSAMKAELLHEEQKMRAAFPSRRMSRRVYMAGPLFTLGQTYFLDEVRRCLEEQGVAIFSPKDDVGLVMKPSDVARVVAADLAGLDKCGIVFAILDGMDPGTLFELGYAVAKKGKAIIGFGQRLSDFDLTMLKGSRCQIYADLATAVYHTAWLAHRK